MITIKIINYETVSGKQPFEEWLQGLDSSERAFIRTRIDRVRMGNFGNCEPIKKGVSELKLDRGPGYRIYFSKIGKTIVLLLVGGIKRTQERDIEKAVRYWQDFKERYEKKTYKL